MRYRVNKVYPDKRTNERTDGRGKRTARKHNSKHKAFMTSAS